MKILRILIINFFVCSAVFGDIKYQSLPKDVVSGNKYYRIPDGSPFKEHGIQIVDKKDGYPVRAGEKSIRFELRSGDCGKYKPPGRDDCKHYAERHEFHGKDFSKGKYKIISFYAKKARGLMAAWILKNKIKENQLNNFNSNGYYYSHEESSKNSPVFLRD